MKSRPFLIKLLAVLMLVGGLAAWAGSSGLSQQANPLGIIVEPDELQVNIWVDKSAYQVGEEITIHFWVNKPAWVYIIDIDAAGRARLIFPNRYDRDNYVSQGGEYSLPGPSDPYRFVVVPPTGTEYVQIIASTQPLDLDVQGFREAFPLLGADPNQVGAQIQGIIPTGAETATAWTSFQVVSAWPPPPPPPPPTNRPPVASFTWSPYYPWVSQPVTFDASSSYDPDGWITTYRWDFNGDSVTDAWGARVVHSFSSSGSYPVTLTVIDNLGASSQVTYTIWVRGAPPPPPPPPPPVPAAGFYIDIEPGRVLHIAVQGSAAWWFPHQYRIELETDGTFTSVRHQISGGVAPLGIVPEPEPRATLVLSGSVATGRVDYYVTLSHDATKIKFKLMLDWDGDGDLDLRTDNVYIGPSLRNPPSNPFVLHFPSGVISWAYAQICWVLVDQPGFRFIICFSFNP